jgi:transcriptional regulator with XRE-family HTH domain
VRWIRRGVQSSSCVSGYRDNYDKTECGTQMNRGRPDNALEYAPSGVLYVGSAIRQMRQAKKLGLRKLAALIPYHYGTLSNVENNRGTVSKETLQRIAELLEVDAQELACKPLHPRLSTQHAGAQEPSILFDENRELKELKSEVQELKAEVVAVKAMVKALHYALLPNTPQQDPEEVVSHESTNYADAEVSRRDLEEELTIYVPVVMVGGNTIRDWEKKERTPRNWEDCDWEQAKKWNEVITSVEAQAGDQFLVMNGFPGVTVPQAQHAEQARPILERGGKAAELMKHALLHWERRQAVFEKQVQTDHFRHIMPITALDWYVKIRFYSPDA